MNLNWLSKELFRLRGGIIKPWYEDEYIGDIDPQHIEFISQFDSIKSFREYVEAMFSPAIWHEFFVAEHINVIIPSLVKNNDNTFQLIADKVPEYISEPTITLFNMLADKDPRLLLLKNPRGENIITKSSDGSTVWSSYKSPLTSVENKLIKVAFNQAYSYWCDVQTQKKRQAITDILNNLQPEEK